MLMEWACNRYGKGPAEVRRQLSLPLLLVYFDAYWWGNVAQPPEKPA